MTPAVSIIIPWRDRDELGTALAHNTRQLASAEHEWVLVNCGGDRERLELLVQRAAPEALLRTIHFEAPAFNKALTLNVGVLHARAEVLMFLDADVLIDQGFPGAALRELDGDHFVTLGSVRSPTAAAAVPGPSVEDGVGRVITVLEFVRRDGRSVRVEANQVDLDRQSRSAPGIIVVERRAFLAVNGMNSDLEGCGWEDLDLIARLGFLKGLRRKAVGEGIHVDPDPPRPDQPRRGRPHEHMNFLICRENYRLGYYLGTYADDAATWAGPTGLRGTGPAAGTP